MIDARLLWRRIDLLEKRIRMMEDGLNDMDRKRQNGVLIGPGAHKGRPTKAREALRKALMVLIYDQTDTYRRIRELNARRQVAA